MAKTSKKTIWIGSSITVIVFAVLLNTVFVQVGHGLWSIARHSLLVILFLAAGAGIAYWASVIRPTINRNHFSYRGPAPEQIQATKKSNALYTVASILAVASILMIPVQIFMTNHGMLKNTSVTVTTDAASLSFKERVPFDVAQAVSDRSLGDTSGNSTGSVKAVPTSDVYTTSVIRRGLFQGYESVQSMSLPLYGAANTNSDVKFCNYSENAGSRLGGLGLNNNLNMKILMKTSPSTTIDASDATAYCAEGGTDASGKAVSVPMLYVPLTKLQGGLIPYRAPAGVAIYNGSTGELKIEDSVSNAPVSVYPKSLAKSQRNSLHAENGFADFFFKRAGFDDTSKDVDDPNAGNNSEFALVTKADENPLYATPLTPRGSSSSIVGLSTIDSNVVESGKLNPLTVHRYEDGKTRDANSTVAATIVSTVLEGYKANGLTVFEVVPAADGTWTASIGRNQSILYRANIASDGHTVTLTDSSGKKTIGNLGDGQDGGSVEETPAGDNTDVPVTGKPLDQMSPEELKSLADQITEELVKRTVPAE